MTRTVYRRYSMDQAREATALTKPIDYDSPRGPGGEIADASLEELTARTAAKSPTADLDEAEAHEDFELPGADLSGEELTVPVIPMQPDEFRCTHCFLVHHRSQLAARPDGQNLCQECS
jgi:Domain of unknown function (DUF4193)